MGSTHVVEEALTNHGANASELLLSKKERERCSAKGVRVGMAEVGLEHHLEAQNRMRRGAERIFLLSDVASFSIKVCWCHR